MPCKDSRAQQEEERLLFFPGKGSANEKPGTLCLQPSLLPFPSIKGFSFPCCVGTCTGLTMAADPELQISTDLNKPFSAVEISGIQFA